MRKQASVGFFVGALAGIVLTYLLVTFEVGGGGGSTLKISVAGSQVFTSAMYFADFVPVIGYVVVALGMGLLGAIVGYRMIRKR